MQREYKKLIYKQAHGTPNGDTLQVALTKAIKKHPRPGKRLEPLGNDGLEVRFIGYARNSQQLLLGVFHKLTKGKAQEVIQMVNEGDEWPVTMVTAKSQSEDSEFIEGTLFFAVWKNHVIIHQTSTCRAESFQDHLSWLLQRVVGTGGNEEGVVQAALIELADPLPPSIRRKSKVPVTRIRLGSELQAKVSNSTPSKSESQSTHSQVFFKPTGRIWKALLEILEDAGAPLPKDLTLREPLSDSDLKVSLDLYCTKKKAQSGAGEVLDIFRKALSHTDKNKFAVELADGSKITGEAMKVGKNFGVDCVDRHPVHQSIFKSMLEYMAMLVEDETIVEDEPFGNVR